MCGASLAGLIVIPQSLCPRHRRSPALVTRRATARRSAQWRPRVRNDGASQPELAARSASIGAGTGTYAGVHVGRALATQATGGQHVGLFLGQQGLGDRREVSVWDVALLVLLRCVLGHELLHPGEDLGSGDADNGAGAACLVVERRALVGGRRRGGIREA